MSVYRSQWAKTPRPAQDLSSLAKVQKHNFNSDFFSTDCLAVSFEETDILYMGSNRLASKRAETLFTKEPTTIPWLDTFAESDIFYDIGANVGMYSIYAAKVTNCRTYAFEPESLNYAELNKNIYINRLNDRVLAYNIAISDELKVGELFLGAFGYSYSHHDFNENTWKEDHFFGEKFTSKDARLKQGCVSYSVDDLITRFGLPVPNHIKVDVDGLEPRVFAGLQNVLNSSNLRTILIEMDFRLDGYQEILDAMLTKGWTYSVDQVRANRRLIMTEDQVDSIRKNRKGGFNIIFYKDDFYEKYFRHFINNYSPSMKK